MTFRLRLSIVISLLIAITFGIGGALLISVSFQNSLNKETDAALSSFETVQNTLYLLNSLGGKNDYETLSQALRQMEQQGISPWQAIRLTSDSETLYQSGADVLLSAEQTLLLPQPGEGQCVYRQTFDDGGHGLLIQGAIHADDQELQLVMRFDLSPVYEARDAQLRLELIIYGLVALLSVLVSALLAFALTKRLRLLTLSVQRIAGGDLTTRSRLTQEDEFGQLSRDIDAMADHLESTIQKLEGDMQQQELFMGNLAHELKTPMTSIIGYADLLRQDSLDDNARITAASYIFSEGKRLEKLSFKLLDLLLLKHDEITLQPVSLAAYIRDIGKLLAPSLMKRGIQLTCRAQRAVVDLQPDLVKSLLYNLVDNAAKAIDGEGGQILLEAVRLPGGCRILVRDNGRGMEKSELVRITDAFYRVDKARSRSLGGAGLGLSLCKEIAALHHGSIRFASAPGQGTQVTVTLYGSGGASHEKA